MHDCSEGGLAVALAETAFAGDWGIDVNLSMLKNSIKKDEILLFSESNSRFVVTIPPEKMKLFENILKNQPCYKIGTVTKKKKLVITGYRDKPVIDGTITSFRHAWKKPLQW